MGNCCGQLFGTNRKAKAQRHHGWAATGIVALRDERLKEIPQTVQEVGLKVTTLDVTNNRLTGIPDFVLNLSNMQRLMLGRNSIVELPATFGQLPELKILFLDQNQISSLPESFCQLPKLEKLSLSGNNLSSLPAAFGQLKHLKEINLAGNRLKSFPESMGECESLEEIAATDNYLEGLPTSFGGLKKLKVLTLDKNRVTAVPSEVLVNCISLQTLSLHENPITPETLHSTEGYEEFEKRRQGKANKAIAAGVMLGQGAMDEGIDRKTK